MAASPWSYDPDRRQYRNQETGRWLPTATVQGLRDSFVDSQKETPRLLAASLAAKQITLGQWETQSREHVKRTFVAEALLGRGGKGQMTPADYGAVGNQIRRQYEALRGFAHEIGLGTLTEAQIGARGQLYVEAASQAYERARAATFDISLPSLPGDQNQQCGANCRCGWDIEETDAGVEATWTLSGEGNSCDDCQANAEQWNPLVFPAREPAPA